MEQNKESSKIGQYKKSLISTFQCFLTVIGKICLEEILGTTSRVFEIAQRSGGAEEGSQILMGQFKPFSMPKTAFCKYWTSIKIKINMVLVPKEYEIKAKMEQEQWLLLKMLLGYNLKIYLMQGGIGILWEGIFLDGGGMSKFLAGGERIPHHFPVGKTLISTLVWDFFYFKAIYIPCLSY